MPPTDKRTKLQLLRELAKMEKREAKLEEQVSLLASVAAAASRGSSEPHPPATNSCTQAQTDTVPVCNPPKQSEGPPVLAGKRKRADAAAEESRGGPLSTSPSAGYRRPRTAGRGLVAPGDLLPLLATEDRAHIWQWFREEHGASFWRNLPMNIRAQLKQTAELQKAMGLLDDYIKEGLSPTNTVAQRPMSQQEKDFCFCDVDSWPSTDNPEGTLHHYHFENAMRRVYHFHGNRGLQRQRDTVLEEIRDLWQFRSPQTEAAWKYRIRDELNKLKALEATYVHRDEHAGKLTRELHSYNRLPQSIRDVRVWFKLEYEKYFGVSIN